MKIGLSNSLIKSSIVKSEVSNGILSILTLFLTGPNDFSVI